MNLKILIPTAPPITVMVTANYNTSLMVGQTSSILTCDVSGAERLSPTIDYQWTRNDETVSDGNSRTLTLSPIQLSHAGNYTCSVTVSSSLLNNTISAPASNSQLVIILSKLLILQYSSSIVVVNILPIKLILQQFQIHNLLLPSAALVTLFIKGLLSI